MRSNTSSWWKRRSTSRLRIERGATLVAAAALVCVGCSDQGLDAAVRKIFRPRLTPQQYMILAVSDSDPDIRRSSTAKLAESKQVSRDWAIRGLTTIALLESDPQARCVAIRGLVRSGDPNTPDTVLRILAADVEPSVEVRPPDALVRWDAMDVLADFLAAGKVSEELRPRAQAACLRGLRGDPERHVRIAAARCLGYLPSDEGVKALVGGLRDSDFAVIHESETALARLTGRTFGCDPRAWESWLAESGERMFASGGMLPAARGPRYRNWMDESVGETVGLFRWLFPPPKEQ